MRYKWLNQNNNKKFILFMNGWGMNESVVSNLKSKDYDILMIYDYRRFDYELTNYSLDEYEEKYLVAWSMGVWVSGLLSDILNNFNKKIALSGTQKIIDDKYGIPKRIYNYTINHFSPESADKFIKNMFLSNPPKIEIDRTTQELKEELISIQKLKIDFGIKYDRAIIPKEDIIVPYKNQLRYWGQTSAEIVEIPSAHYVFNCYSNWQDIIC